MFKNFSEKFLKKTHSRTQIALVLGILIVINILLFSVNFRLDLTEAKEYTLSDATVKKIRELSDPVTIKVFFSTKVPSDLLHTRQSTEDILSEYQGTSGRNVKVEWIDPKDDAELKSQAQSYGIPELQFNVVEKDQFQVTTGFAGLVILYEDKTEVIPAIQSTENLEYDLTAALFKLTRKEPLKVAFLTGHEEKESESLNQFLSKQYEIESIDTTKGDLIADDIKTIVINGPKKELSERERFIVDQFLLKGKGVVMLLDSVDIDTNLQATPVSTGLDDMLKSYGITLQKNLVVDPVSHENVSFGGGLFTIVTGYPFWPKIVKGGFNPNSPTTAQLESLVLPWARSLTLTTDKKKEGDTLLELAKTSSKSWAMEAPFQLSPQQDLSGQGKVALSYTVAALRSGSFESFFKGKDVPGKEKGKKGDEKIVESTDQGRLVVVGDSDFVREETLGQFPDNALFFQNILDAATQEDSLTAIRARGIKERPLISLQEGEKSALKYGNIFSSLLLVAVMAGIRWQWKKRKVAEMQKIVRS